MLKNYIKTAWRALLRNKVYAAINVAGLSIGLTATMLIMLYAKDEVSYDRFHADHPHIYRIISKSFTPEGSLESQFGNTGYMQGPKFQEGVPEIQAYVRFGQNRRDIRQGNEVKSLEVLTADSGFFSLFSFPLLSGDPKTALQHPRSAVISEEMANIQFGTTDALGETVFLKDPYREDSQFDPYLVTGVAKKSPQNSSIKFDVLVPMVVGNEVMDDRMNWFNRYLNTFVLLDPDADIQAVEDKMNRVYQADARDAIGMVAEKYGDRNERRYGLQALTDIHLNKELNVGNGLVDASNPMYSFILSGIALFILLIACINFINLTVARSLKRAKEIGIRKVVGGGRGQLIMQFLGESFLLCFAAFLLALVLVQFVLPTFNQLSNKALSLGYLFDTGLILGYLVLFLATSLLAGFYPALVLSDYNPVQTLYNRFNLSGKNYLQKSLVIVQFAIASFLIVGTLTIYSQFNYLTDKDLGYDDRGVVTVDKPNLTHHEAQVWKDELLRHPAILSVAPKNGGRSGTAAKINGETQLGFDYETVDAAYLPLLGIPIVEGRNFSPDFPSDSTQSVLVNETFVKVAGWENPIGEEVDFWYNENETYRVVGVVKDHHYRALNEEIGAQLFTMKPQNSYGKLFVKIKPNTETASLRHIEETFKKLFPTNPYVYRFQDEENLRKYESVAKWNQIILFGTVLTIFISCIGLFGLATLSAERRTKEIGIRKVLGASVNSIVRKLSTDFIKLVFIAILIASPFAWWAMNKWLADFAYRIDIEWWMFGGAGLLSILIALLTVSFQSVRTALMNPVESLRSE